jgi:hypothetical protein
VRRHRLRVFKRAAAVEIGGDAGCPESVAAEFLGKPCRGGAPPHHAVGVDPVLDRAVFAAYGWPADIGGDELLTRLVTLNRERWEEEGRGRVRWLRPEFQTGIRIAAAQPEMEIAISPATDLRQVWPRGLTEQFRAVRAALVAQNEPAEVEQLAALFVRARRDRVAEVLATLVSLGQARETTPGRYAT